MPHPTQEEADTKIAELGLVAAGVGVALISESMTRLARQGVAYRPIAGPTLRLRLALLVMEDPPPRAKELIGIALNSFDLARRQGGITNR